MEDNIFGDRQQWGDYTKIWLAERSEEQAFPNAVGESNIFLTTIAGKCVKDYITTNQWKIQGVDLGCNYAGMALHFVNAGIEYTGVDQSSVAIDFAKKKFPSFKFILSLLWKLDIKEEYDIAYMQAVLQHNTWDEQEKIIPRIFDLLKPGGIWYFSEGTATPDQVHKGMNSRTHEGWIDLMTRHGFHFEKAWYYNAEKIPNVYLFTKPARS